jgi:predicted phosphodiesterase
LSETVRVLVLSDIHSNLPALESILKIADNYHPQFIISLGDYVGYGSYPNECLEIARKFDIVLMGNHDAAAAVGNAEGFKPDAKFAIEWTSENLNLGNKTFIATFRDFLRFKIIPDFNWEVFICHGTPEDYIGNYLMPNTPDHRKIQLVKMTECNVLMTGHTHFPLEFRCDDGIILNPGSVGQPRDGDPRASAMIIDFYQDWQNTKIELIRAEYDILQMATDMRKKGLPHKLSERLFFGK